MPLVSRLWFVVACLVALMSCDVRAQTVTPDDTAHVLAGLAPAAGSPLSALTEDPAWRRHAAFFDSAFNQLEQRQLSKIRTWADANVAAPRPTMFYFFSGPDFLYADAFYPKATTYVMAALEPTGPIPDLSRLPRGSIGPALSYVERSLQSILSFSFFITKNMKADLRDGEIEGTLPILYVFLARTGKTIRGASLIWLDETGAVHEANEPPARNATKGARIVFAGSDGVEKTLYYFSTDLSDTGAKASGFLKFCEPLAPGNSLLKSASYLLHESFFSRVRSWLLRNSATMIQDDSGIPLASYDARAWRFFPFGRYAGPIDKFPDMYQASYARLFERAQPLEFGIGYRWRTRESNVLLAVRSPSADATISAEATGPAETSDQPPRVRRAPRPPEPIPNYPPPPRRDDFFFFPRW
ncbi:hypothetical protein SSBR45G_27340 [Bradyrhizobium sp. SSBR45G]|uniref:hypothetical protein n=1 Tax=unclassified Bradyrhizobium TaxID=2631580 RepID=UPI002342B2D0|nr:MULTISPECIES: hypothetical protein [unclassified Bradyrhizobium]GLH77826.1 hypothetical protein SSBR45G_27340 [Bradyrhizobium sp. SSBR45G]GLH85553.1 hypothetical protein SSBR45R_30130 [Bradyrhizobium sp. SSBR45R]